MVRSAPVEHDDPCGDGNTVANTGPIVSGESDRTPPLGPEAAVPLDDAHGGMQHFCTPAPLTGNDVQNYRFSIAFRIPAAATKRRKCSVPFSRQRTPQ
jgi:hypothetical protein